MASEKYLVAIGDKLRVITEKKISNLTMIEVIMLTFSCTAEQQKQLIRDSINKQPKQFYGRNVVEGLEHSLSRLNQLGVSDWAGNNSDSIQPLFLRMSFPQESPSNINWIRQHIKRFTFNNKNINN